MGREGKEFRCCVRYSSVWLWCTAWGPWCENAGEGAIERWSLPIRVIDERWGAAAGFRAADGLVCEYWQEGKCAAFDGCVLERRVCIYQRVHRLRESEQGLDLFLRVIERPYVSGSHISRLTNVCGGTHTLHSHWSPVVGLHLRDSNMRRYGSGKTTSFLHELLIKYCKGSNPQGGNYTSSSSQASSLFGFCWFTVKFLLSAFLTSTAIWSIEDLMH